MTTAMTWLLDSDPAVRWQVLADLADAPADEVARERARVAETGWGERLLDLQVDGQWADGACFPGGDWRAAHAEPHPRCRREHVEEEPCRSRQPRASPVQPARLRPAACSRW